MKAQDFLRKGADLLEERGKQYDQPGGERSMGKAVRAFNTITGRSLYESEGWLLLQILKDVRQWQNPNSYHADSAEDCVSYAALKAEALAVEGGIVAAFAEEPAAAMQDDSERMAVIGQSGEMALEVYAAVDWAKAPEWAAWLAHDEEGAHWYEIEPSLRLNSDKNWAYPLGYEYESIHDQPMPVGKWRRPHKDATQ